jgi:hypothetical protein
MALIERLMNVSTDDTPGNRRIPVHDFFAAQSEVMAGKITVAQVKSFLNMDSATATEYDALVATAPTGTSAAALANKALFVNGVHSKFILAEKRYPGYSTPAELRANLGI